MISESPIPFVLFVFFVVKKNSNQSVLDDVPNAAHQASTLGKIMNHHEERREHEGNAFDELSHRVIGCAIEGHRVLGLGLLESSFPQNSQAE